MSLYHALLMGGLPGVRLVEAVYQTKYKFSIHVHTENTEHIVALMVRLYRKRFLR